MSAHATGIEKGTEAVSPDKLTGLRFPNAAAPVPSQEKQSVNPTADPLRPASVVSPEAGTSEDDDDEVDNDEGYPEGGLKAWLVVLGSWLALFSALGLMNTLATFQAYVSTHQLQDHSEGQIGWIFSVYTFLTFFCGIYIGPIFDKYGPKWLVLAGTILLVASLILLSFSTEYWHFLLSFGILSGFASSLLFTPSIAAVGHFFKKRRGLATGIASTGGSVGGVIFPLMLTNLFERIGWAWAVRVQALLSFTLCAASNFLIRSRLPPPKNAKVHPDFLIFRDVTMLLTTIGIFLLEFALFIPLTYITSYMLASGFDETFAFNTLAIFNAASVLGRALPGYWGDKFGPFNSNMGATLLSIFGALVVWLPFGKTTPGVIIFAILIGFASGNNISISPVCIGRLCHTKHYGRYYATSYTVVAVACLVSIPIGGEILAATGGNYWALIVFTGLLYVASFVVLLAAKISYVGWKPLAIF
ncbi:related to monocarboxylate transporter 2 [Cephalotrichum gorgonifer]|uniref:Related to monocarboxylate transporter 2 n=1 Tax=Cephalotrichum gorgonifer TaxID=2041049 RepID=A0AAE8MVK9_9PEZI|nr:related to monocarboxylate transporter 2 [Cephalotrichum gorgonifer]